MAKKEPQSCITTPYKTTCGGQALIEGIMMQGPDRRAVVVRKPDGELDVTTWEVEPRKSIWRLPFLRGLKTFCSSMYHGIKALMYSADVSGEMEVEDEELTGLDKWINDHFSDEKASALIIGIAAVLGVAFSIGLFILLPTAVTGLIGLVWKTMPLWFRSVLEGIIKVAIFMGYLFLCSRMKEIHRVFEYHGAEHKTIYCYENGLELTVENVEETAPAPSSLRYQLSVRGDCGVHFSVHRHFYTTEDREHLAADAAASAVAADDCVRYL